MTTALFVIGAAAVIAGCALISVPLALIVGGFLLGAGAVALERGADR